VLFQYLHQSKAKVLPLILLTNTKIILRTGIIIVGLEILKMKNTATVKIFLAHGSPTSVRTAELSNWTGKAVAGPRSQIEDVLKRDEANYPGVYFLTGIKFPYRN
jgi:hypothetical protein